MTQDLTSFLDSLTAERLNKSNLRKPEEVQEWLMALEMERHDLSHRTYAPRPQEPKTQVIVVKQAPPKRDPKADEALNRLYFHAGRYSAGIRDKESIEAHMKLRKKREPQH